MVSEVEEDTMTDVQLELFLEQYELVKQMFVKLFLNLKTKLAVGFFGLPALPFSLHKAWDAFTYMVRLRGRNSPQTRSHLDYSFWAVFTVNSVRRSD